ncbi:hypothetical protein LTR39_004947 [Cryomyces antarcticus]|nr:hypothetical protein LTR39_004947 [Cryomyces antarcticus]
MLLNVGVWGPGSSRYEEFVHQNRMLEDKVQELDGMKWLYAHAYYTEDEFWSIYDRQWYDALRAKYNATWLPSVYDKVKVDVQAQLDAQSGSWVAWSKSMLWSIWPLSGLWGVYKAFTGQEYLMPRSTLQCGRRMSVPKRSTTIVYPRNATTCQEKRMHGQYLEMREAGTEKATVRAACGPSAAPSLPASSDHATT